MMCNLSMLYVLFLPAVGSKKQVDGVVVEVCLAGEVAVDHGADGGGAVWKAPQFCRYLGSACAMGGAVCLGVARTPLSTRLSTRRCAWVLLPHRSMPSNTMNAPRRRLAAPIVRRASAHDFGAGGRGDWVEIDGLMMIGAEGSSSGNVSNVIWRIVLHCARLNILLCLWIGSLSVYVHVWSAVWQCSGSHRIQQAKPCRQAGSFTLR